MANLFRTILSIQYKSNKSLLPTLMLYETLCLYYVCTMTWNM